MAIEIITVDNCKHVTIQSLNCLEDVKDSLVLSKGRWEVGLKITTEEAPEWFTQATRILFSARVRSAKWQRRKATFKRIWSAEDLEYLVKHWKKRPLQSIADGLGKTTKAVRTKASTILSPEDYEARFYNKKNGPRAGEKIRQALKRKLKKGEE